MKKSLFVLFVSIRVYLWFFLWGWVFLWAEGSPWAEGSISASGGNGVIFSEIYIKPLGSVLRDQWIELKNTSPSNIDVSGYLLGDESEDNRATVSSWSDAVSTPLEALSNHLTNSTSLAPGQFAVVFDNDFTNVEGVLQHLPTNTLVLTVSQNSLKGDTTIKTSNVLRLFDAQGNVIDTYGTPGISDALPLEEQRDGVSLERVFADEGDLEKNWSFCLDSKGHTIGTTNSLTTRHSKDPAVKLALNPFTQNTNGSGVVGRALPLDMYALDRQGRISFLFEKQVYLEYTDDLKISDDGYIKNKMTRGKLIRLQYIGGRGGRFLVSSIYPGTFKLKLSGDGLETSIRLSFSRFKSPYRGKVLISEVMYLSETATDLGGNVYDQGDWIELYNASSETIDLDHWSLVINQSSVYLFTNAVIGNESYLLLVPSISQFDGLYSLGLPRDLPFHKIEVPFGNLSKSDGEIALKDDEGNDVDLLQYTDSYIKEVKRYGQKDGVHQYLNIREFISLERKDQATASLDRFNWGNSSHALGEVSFSTVSGGETQMYSLPILGTPGFANSRSFAREKKLSVSIQRKAYLLDRDSFEPFAFTLEVNASSLIEVKIYSRSGAYLGTLATEIAAGEHGSLEVFFDGDLNGRALSPGLYFVAVRAVGTDTGEHSGDKTYFVIK